MSLVKDHTPFLPLALESRVCCGCSYPKMPCTIAHLLLSERSLVRLAFTYAFDRVHYNQSETSVFLGEPDLTFSVCIRNQLNIHTSATELQRRGKQTGVGLKRTKRGWCERGPPQPMADANADFFFSLIRANF